jgi:hypothetical protein
VKNPNSLVKYHFSSPFTIETTRKPIVNFHIPTLIKEVKQLPKKKRKEFITITKSFLATATTFLMLPLRSMAQSSIPVGTTTLPNTATGMPPELLELLLTLLKISVGAAVILAAILLVANGVGKMFKINGMTQWAKDIIRGLIQVLIAVPVVFLIYYLANLLFSGNGWFVSPF